MWWVVGTTPWTRPHPFPTPHPPKLWNVIPLWSPKKGFSFGHVKVVTNATEAALPPFSYWP